MIKKHAVLLFAVLTIIFIIIATQVYPGGSLLEKKAIGFNWSKNFFSNLFAENAINGMENRSRIWAIVGMAFHSIAYGLFFINMSKKIPTKNASTILKLTGTLNILFSFLIVTPLHDIMITLSSTLFLIALFYITVFILKSQLHLFKFLCIICLLTYYFTLYLYGTKYLELLAIMQKISLISSMLLVLLLEYFTSEADFKYLQPRA